MLSIGNDLGRRSRSGNLKTGLGGSEAYLLHNLHVLHVLEETEKNEIYHLVNVNRNTY